jgi:hypothetical protein
MAFCDCVVLCESMLRVCLSCALLFVEWPQAASPLSKTLQPAPHDPMVGSVVVSRNNKGRQRVYIDSHYLDNIDNNAVIINVHLYSYSEQNNILLWRSTDDLTHGLAYLVKLGVVSHVSYS